MLYKGWNTHRKIKGKKIPQRLKDIMIHKEVTVKYLNFVFLSVFRLYGKIYFLEWAQELHFK